MSQQSIAKTKVYVPVIVAITTDGQMYPRSLVWEDSKCFTIDKVLGHRPIINPKWGAHCDQYTVIIQGRQKYLYYENGRWFVERK